MRKKRKTNLAAEDAQKHQRKGRIQRLDASKDKRGGISFLFFFGGGKNMRGKVSGLAV